MDPALIDVLDRVSVRSLHDILEVRTIDAHNARVAEKIEAEKRGRR